jgi:hypothetical protein
MWRKAGNAALRTIARRVDHRGEKEVKFRLVFLAFSLEF